MQRSLARKGILLALSVSSISLRAMSEPAGRLLYERGYGAESCPDETALRRAVAARLGEDPFDSHLSRTFQVKIALEGARLRGSVEVLTDGVAEGRRELEAPSEACTELVDAMALAVSLTINPELVVTVAPAPAKRVESTAIADPKESRNVAPLASPNKRAPRDTRRPARTAAGSQGPPLTLGVGALVHGAVGTGPGVAVGGSAVVRAGGSRFQLGLEGRVDTQSRAHIGRNGSVHSTLAAGVLAPCVRFVPFSACPLLLLGSVFAYSRGVTVERSDSGFFAAAGGRLATSAPLAEDWLLEARVDALHAVTPVTIELDGAPVWRAGASGALGVGVVWEIP